jgi:hypothetical protein
MTDLDSADAHIKAFVERRGMGVVASAAASGRPCCIPYVDLDSPMASSYCRPELAAQMAKQLLNPGVLNEGAVSSPKRNSFESVDLG